MINCCRREGQANINEVERDTSVHCPVQPGPGQVSQTSAGTNQSQQLEITTKLSGGHRTQLGHTLHVAFLVLLNGIAGDLIRKLKSTTWALSTQHIRIKDQG